MLHVCLVEWDVANCFQHSSLASHTLKAKQKPLELTSHMLLIDMFLFTYWQKKKEIKNIWIASDSALKGTKNWGFIYFILFTFSVAANYMWSIICSFLGRVVCFIREHCISKLFEIVTEEIFCLIENTFVYNKNNFTRMFSKLWMVSF